MAERGLLNEPVKPEKLYSPVEPPRRQRRPRVDVLLLLLAGICSVLLLQLFGGWNQTAALEEAEPPELPAAEAAHTEPHARLEIAEMPATGEPVRLLMHNVQNYFVAGEQQRSRYVVKPKNEESREAVAAVIAAAKAHVVGLVEVGGPMALADLRTRLEKRGCTYPYYRVLTRPGEDRALAVLSVYPIVRDDSIAQCRLYGKKNRMMLRGILDVTVQTPDKRYFRIMGAHLKSRVGDDAAAAAALRGDESYTLARHIQSALQAEPRLPLAVFGDWNDGPTDASAKVLTQGVSADAALQCLTPADSRGEQWTIHYAAGNEYSAFDRIYLNKTGTKRCKNKVNSGIIDIPAAAKASDHRAVWCELR